MKITIMRTYLLSGMRTIFTAEADGDDVQNAVGAVEFFAAQVGATAIYENSQDQATVGGNPGAVPTATAKRAPRRSAEQKAADEASERAAAAAKAAASFQPGPGKAAAIPQPTVPSAPMSPMAPPLVSMGPTPPSAPQHIGFQPNPTAPQYQPQPSVGAPPAPQPYHVPQYQPAPQQAAPQVHQAPPVAPTKGPHWDAWYGTVDAQIRALNDHAPPHLAPQIQASVNGILARHGNGMGLAQMSEAQMSAVFNDLQAAYPPVPSQPGRM